MIIAPFALARRFRITAAWRRWFWPSVVFGVVMFVLLIAYGGLNGAAGQGLVQRTMAATASGAVIAMAAKLLKRA